MAPPQVGCHADPEHMMPCQAVDRRLAVLAPLTA